MRTGVIISLFIAIVVLLGAGLLLFVGGFSKPRDFSSPETSICIVDEKGSPVTNIEVDRNWYDSDVHKEGSETTYTDVVGVARFKRVPAKVGVFTGVGVRALGFLSPCGTGSGTRTTIYVRFHGNSTVAPKDKILHAEGHSNRDQDGVWFYTTMDSGSNTLANLTFPGQMNRIDYVLQSRAQQ